MGDRIYTFTTEYRYEREKWYEAIRNSRRTVKEINNSISKKPRNVAYLVNIFEKQGQEKIKEHAISRKDNAIKFFTDM